MMEDITETIDLTDLLEDDTKTKTDEFDDNNKLNVLDILNENLNYISKSKETNVEEILVHSTEEEKENNFRRYSNKLKSDLKPSYEYNQEYDSILDDNDVAMQELLKTQSKEKKKINDSLFKDSKKDSQNSSERLNVSISNIGEIEENKGSLNDYLLKQKEEQFNFENLINEQKEYIIPQLIKNPIEFIEYVEKYLYKNYINQNEDKFLQIKKYKNNNKEKFESLSTMYFPNKVNLNNRIFQSKDKKITCIGIRCNFLFVGDDTCKIKMYSLDKQFEYKTFYIEKISDVFEQEINGKIEKCRNSTTCIDVSPMCNYMISGYKNGFIALWDIKSGKCEKILKDEYVVDKTGVLCILALKFLSQSKQNNFSFISSDGRGYVNKITISENFFGWVSGLNVTVTSLIQYRNPIFVLEVMELSEEEKKMEFYQNNQSDVVAFGCVDYILIYQVTPSVVKYFSFNRPEYFEKYYVPDISFGIGYVPRRFDIINAEKDSNESINFLAAQNEIDVKAKQRLIAISWDTFIYIYCIKIDRYYGPQKVICVGSYNNDTTIVRNKFIGESSLLIYEKTKNKNKIKLLNTGLMSPNELMLNPDTYKPFYHVEKEIRSYMQNPYLFDEKDEFCSQYICPIHNIVNNKIVKCAAYFKETYFNTFLIDKNQYFILCKNKIIIGKFKTYSEFLEELKEQSRWIELFAYGENIYLNKYNALIDLPIEKKERSIEVGQKLREIVVYFINLNFKKNKSQGPMFKENLKKCVILALEFCIHIKSVSFLINEIKPIFDKKGLENFFIESLQPFILSGILSDKEFSIEFIEKLITYYLSQNKIHILGQIIINLKPSVINFEACRRISKMNNIFTALIFLNTCDDDKNFFLPFKNMFQFLITNQNKKLPRILKIQEDSKNFDGNQENGFDFTKIIRCIDLDYLVHSYNYLGNKIIWYFNYCLNKKLFPNDEKINDVIFEDLVKKIFLTLFNNMYMTSLLKINSYGFFELLKKIFMQHWKIINNIKYDKILFEGIDIKLNDKSNKSEPVDIKLFIQIVINLISKSESYPGDLYLKDDIADFICNIATDKKIFSKTTLIKAIKHLMHYEINKKKRR